MTVEAYAKVNLTLEVYGKRPDGYHALRSVVQPITLADTLEIEPTEDGSISSDTGYGEKDLIVKAARCLASLSHATGMSRLLCSHATGMSRLLCSHATGMSRLLCGCHVKVTKRIPAGGGLGGGSADAAATLLALNELWNLKRTPEELAELGATVGSDVPALVLAQHYRSPVLMEGRGERVSLIPHPSSLIPHPTFLVLANPGVHSSTSEVFARCTPRTEDATTKGDATFLSREGKGDATFLSREEKNDFRLFNDLQAPAIALHPEIAAALESLRSLGAKDVMMSGSGATVFGFSDNAAEADCFAKEMCKFGFSAWSCGMISKMKTMTMPSRSAVWQNKL